jgi:hypothetical protein
VTYAAVPEEFETAYDFVDRFRSALLAAPRNHHLTVDEWLGEALEALAVSLTGMVECIAGRRTAAPATRDTLVMLSACLQEAANESKGTERPDLSVRDAARVSFDLAAPHAQKPAGVAPLIVTLLGRVVKAGASGSNGVDGSSRADLLAAALGQALFAALAVSGGIENLLQAAVPTTPP